MSQNNKQSKFSQSIMSLINLGSSLCGTYNTYTGYCWRRYGNEVDSVVRLGWRDRTIQTSLIDDCFLAAYFFSSISFRWKFRSATICVILKITFLKKKKQVVCALRRKFLDASKLNPYDVNLNHVFPRMFKEMRTFGNDDGNSRDASSPARRFYHFLFCK